MKESILLILGGINMILAIIFDSVPQAILGAMVFYLGIKLILQEDKG